MAGENIGWRLENVVFIELLRRCSYDFRDIYYYKAHPRAKEVDFVVCDKDRALELIQVAYEIDTPEILQPENIRPYPGGRASPLRKSDLNRILSHPGCHY